MKELEMLLQDSIDASVRKYVKSGEYSKKNTKQFYSYGNWNDIMLSIKKFDEWLDKSRKGDKIMYYRGFLFSPNKQKLSPTLDLKRVSKLAKRVYGAYNINGDITLVQKKHDNFDYEYWAVRL
jgi:hypothetical protein|tara:strand:+ start:44 stop:412 length:369 start_codon:yes stop_codon:yes gene_type:complete